MHAPFHCSLLWYEKDIGPLLHFLYSTAVPSFVSVSAMLVSYVHVYEHASSLLWYEGHYKLLGMLL